MSERQKTRDFNQNMPKTLDQNMIRNVESAIPKRRWHKFLSFRVYSYRWCRHCHNVLFSLISGSHESWEIQKNRKLIVCKYFSGKICLNGTVGVSDALCSATVSLNIVSHIRLQRLLFSCWEWSNLFLWHALSNRWRCSIVSLQGLGANKLQRWNVWCKGSFENAFEFSST